MRNTLVFSAPSIWEVSIKSARGRDAFQVAAAVLRRGSLGAGCQELEISSAHEVAVDELPTLHRDPFDRMLVVHSRVEGLALLTRDKQVAAYEAASLFD